ncbi:MAG TPA: adenylate/guanylate cyclase domain-containing protein [Candidatus Binataceae bacterium]|nr:adenylate/guanylate cyclase domain-containing protein [Candidatus Binataceae bacterium]
MLFPLVAGRTTIGFRLVAPRRWVIYESAVAYFSDNPMRCSNCQAENPVGKKFCGDCGTALANLCPQCGADNPAGKRFCGECGSALGAPAAGSAKKLNDSQIRVSDTSASVNLEGERKTVTALFADIKGSTELEQDLDPEEARAIVDPALRLMIDAVRRYDGYVVQSTGDGIFALFGAPVAHEDHPQRALYAALRMQDELRRYSTKLREGGNLPIEARVGVNTGEVVVRSITTGKEQAEYTPIGHTTNLASRMEALAPTGSIAISEQTRKLVEGYFALKPLGPTRVKGISEQVNVYEVTGLGPLRTRLQRSAGRGLTKFVGREREMEVMSHAAERATSGRGQIVAAIAEAGTGKSRLFFEFKAKNQSGWTVLEAFSVSHGKASAYLPVIDLLHGYFRIVSDDDARARREKLNGKVLTLDRSLEDTLPYLFALLGVAEGDDALAQMDGQVKKRRTVEAIKRIFLRESLNQPLMVIFEDLHWIDEETQAFLNVLADSIATARVLLLVNYRAEYSHSWNSRTYYTQLRLDPLGRESAQEMLSALLGDGGELAALKRVIIEKTEGNPFFMEETVQVLLDEGALVRNGMTRLVQPISALKIPPTVQGILAARIDRLPHEAKDLLQILSVAGREFSMSLIRTVNPKPEEELNRTLNELQLGEFIYEQPAVGEPEYIFKHALTQEVSYNSVLQERRKQLHEQIAAALENLHANSIDDHLDELAHHYGRSGNQQKALEYHELAGLRALQRCANQDAMQHLTAALDLLRREAASPVRDQRELALQTALGQLLMMVEGWSAPETERVFRRAQELAQACGSAEQQFSTLVGWFGIAFVGGQMAVARERMEPTRDFVRQHPEPAFILEASHHEWSLAMSCGELEVAQNYVEHGLALFEAQLRSTRVPLYTAHHPAVCGYGWGAMLSWLRGFPDQARRSSAHSLALARELGDPASIIWAVATKAHFHLLERETRHALEMADAAIAMGEETSFFYVLLASRIVKGWAIQATNPSDGVDQIREAVKVLSESGARLWLSFFLATLAEAYGSKGSIEEGLKTVKEGLELVQQSGERWWEAELYRVQGELLLRRDPSRPGEVRAALESAVEVARKQGGKSLELRATTSLARLLDRQGNRAEARAMLAEIYNWFSEGFDTADLKDARALLDELNAQPV